MQSLNLNSLNISSLNLNSLNLNIVLALVITLFSALVVYLILPSIVRFSLKKKYVNTTKNHNIVVQRKTVRLGGVSLFISAFTLMLVVNLIPLFSEAYHTGDRYVNFPPIHFGEVVALLILFVVGVYDDIKGLGYKIKFLFQTIATGFVIYAGNYVTNLNGLFGCYDISPAFGIYLLTPMFIIFLNNSINFIDGIDGLLSTLSICAFIAYGILFFLIGDILYAIFALILIGSLSVYLYYNLFGMKRYATTKIIMGDCGSLFLGLTISIMAIKLWTVSALDLNTTLVNYAHIIALTMLSIPLLDAVSVILYRLKNRKNIFLPDKNHIHHRLLATGLSKHTVLVIIALINLCFVALNLFLVAYLSITYILLIDITVWAMINIIIYSKRKTI